MTGRSELWGLCDNQSGEKKRKGRKKKYQGRMGLEGLYDTKRGPRLSERQKKKVGNNAPAIN